jgi:hypothetical protein
MLSQFDVLHQTGSVMEYQEEFEKLAHGLLLYNNSYDDTYFVTRFVAGLKDDIRRVIALHRPKNVDTDPRKGTEYKQIQEFQQRMYQDQF